MRYLCLNCKVQMKPTGRRTTDWFNEYYYTCPKCGSGRSIRTIRKWRKKYDFRGNN